MQFKNPEILYLLFFLLIPILIHLFQLQKFEKVAFTNVKLLKEIEQQTRKSSKLKKLLILLSRLLLLSCLIIAFAQPYFSKLKNNLQQETFIYLDNSYSMQAKGESGELLQKSKNDLILHYENKTSKINLITNNQVLKNIQVNDFKKEVLKIDYYPIQKELKTVFLQIESLQNKKTKTQNNIVLISDFQKNKQELNTLKLDSTAVYSFIQTKPVNAENIALDSIWVASENTNNIQLKATVKSYNLTAKDLSVSLFIDKNLFGKTTIDIKKNKQAIVTFNIPYKKNISGKLSLSDNKLTFDNTLYFNLPNKEKTNVFTIGESSSFLTKIYTKEDFNYISTQVNNLNYGLIENQNLIILNELETIPNALIQALNNFVKNDGNIVIIPASKANINTYNNLFKTLNIGTLIGKKEQNKAINSIYYEQPFFKHVFQKQVKNFQYPTVKSFYETQLNISSSLLQFEDKTDFISQLNHTNIYWVSAPINMTNSNFITSPLVVPVFYNFSLQNNSPKRIFYTIGKPNKIFVNSKFKNNDAVFHLIKKDIDFIPLQRKTAKYIVLETEKMPLTDGIYQIKNKTATVQNIAYNYSRSESNLDYFNMNNFTKNIKNANYYTTTSNAINRLNDKHKNKNLWQLFVIFALLFLGLEIVFQKYLKTES